MNDVKVAIYCTGGTKIGYGHFFRSIVFIKSAPRGFETYLFPVAEKRDHHIFNEINDKAIIAETEEQALQNIFVFRPDIIVFDTVFSSDHFLTMVRPNVRYLVSISPVFNQMQKMDFLFTRNPDTPPLNTVKIYSGFEYAIFNENCSTIPDAVYENNLSRQHLTIGIAMGGGDAANKTLKVLEMISEFEKPCTFWILLGEGYRHSYQALVDCISKESNHEIILAKTNRSVWNILANCSVAIFAGGLTTMEALYAGLPSINVFEKEEHIKVTSSKVFNEGMAVNLGLFKQLSSSKLLELIRFFYTDRDQLIKMRNRSKGVLDKLGPKRIYNRLSELMLKN